MLRTLLALLALPFLTACTGEDIVDDYVQPELRLLNAIDSIEVGSSHAFGAVFLNDVGQEEEDVRPEWSSTNEDVLTVTANGTATALAPGSSRIELRYTDRGATVESSHPVTVSAAPVVVDNDRHGTIAASSFYTLTGDFTLTQTGDDLELAFGDDYVADDALPGLYVYLTNNPSTFAGALEIGPVSVFRGAHAYRIPGAGLDAYSHVLYFCKPFRVKVGDGEIVN